MRTSFAREHVAGVLLFASFILGMASTASAQLPLSLTEAIRRARTHNPDALAAISAGREAAERVRQARSGYLPTVDVTESVQRGDDPVFVFSSLLAQRHFTAGGFALAALNHPAPANDVRAALSVEQPLFDRTIAARVREAAVAHDMAAISGQIVSQDLASAVTAAFGRVLIASASVSSAAAAVETARADRALAGNRRDAGLATDADVLQLDVYVARTLERQVQAVADERVARARLNQLMGEPLTAAFSLEPVSPAVALDAVDPAALEEEAVQNRPEVLLARQQQQLAAAGVSAAHAAFLPQVSMRGAWEVNGSTWHSRSSAWTIGGYARVNLFRGFADAARLAEAREQAVRRGIERAKTETMVRLDVQVAIAGLEAARSSEAVGRAAADSARAAHRIIRDRYAGGLADAAALLAAAEAVQQADAQHIAALVNVTTATAILERAAGRL